jgi:leader peptidase (prepilin peptidase)/N-methyltransferase
VLFAYLYVKFPFVHKLNGNFALEPNEAIRFLHATSFSSLLLIASVIDYYHQIIPDVISLPMLAVSPIVATIHPELSLQSSLIGMLIGGGALYLIAWLYIIIRKQAGLGFGDVKFLAAIGGWLGYESLLPTLLIASVVGSFVGIGVIIVSSKMNFKSALPFGPFLALGAFVHLVGERQLLELLFMSKL